MKLNKTINGKTSSENTTIQSELLTDRTIPTSNQARVTMSGGFRVNRFGQEVSLSVSVEIPCLASEVHDATSVLELVIEDVLDRNSESMKHAAESLSDIPHKAEVDTMKMRIEKKTTNKASKK